MNIQPSVLPGHHVKNNLFLLLNCYLSNFKDRTSRDFDGQGLGRAQAQRRSDALGSRPLHVIATLIV